MINVDVQFGQVIGELNGNQAKSEQVRGDTSHGQGSQEISCQVKALWETE
jgi:hypothetical protein